VNALREIERVTAVWPNRVSTTFSNVASNRIWQLEYERCCREN
jgi:hypothetical protein